MPDRKVLIADSSSLISLINIGELDLLKKLYGKVIITPEVEDEVVVDLPNWIDVQSVKDKNLVKILENSLDKGESTAISLAMETELSLVLIDEKKGRKFAKKLGLNVLGLLGVAIKGKEAGYVQNVKPILDRLLDVKFRISDDLYFKILRRVGED